MPAKQSDRKKVIELLNTIPGLGYEDTGIEKKHLDALAILSLPKHLRKTAVTLHKAIKRDVNSISNITGNEKKIECNHLEELVEMGYLRKNIVDDEAFYELI